MRHNATPPKTDHPQQDKVNTAKSGEGNTYNNDNATQRVPESEGRSTLDIIMVSAGYCICVSGLFTGSAMAFGLTLLQGLLVSFLGNVIVVAYASAIGYAGAKERVSTSMLVRHSFGRFGSYIVSFVIAIVMLGWYSVQVGFFGETMHALFPSGGALTSVPVAALWGGILMMITAYVGYRGLSILSKIAVPLIIILAIVAVVVGVNQKGGLDVIAAMEPAAHLSLGAAVVMVVGSIATAGCAQADITRYSKTPRAAVLATILGYLVGNTFIILAGFITCQATGNDNMPAAMIAMGLGAPALLVLIGAQWTTNDNNLYSASLGFTNIIHVKKKHIVLASGILATALGVAGLSNHFSNWLSILGVTLPPMAGIIIADYFIVNKRHYEFGAGTVYRQWNVLAFVAWIIGALVGLFVTFGVPALSSLVVGFIVYLALMFTLGKSWTGLVGTVTED